MTATVDVAGAFYGGAARFLLELDQYLQHEQRDVRVVGRGRRLTPRWLVEREVRVRRSDIRIALNNASFVSTGGKRIALLRNALHFADRADFDALKFPPPVDLRAQAMVVRQLARRADLLIVPTSSMRERVQRMAPGLASRTVVRHHPVTQRPWAGRTSRDAANILVPIIPSPYKHLEEHLRSLASVVRRTEGVTIRVTARPDELPSLEGETDIEWLGRLDATRLDDYWSDAHAVFFPPAFESFGYPLAEARANGRAVIAPDSSQNREVAGAALSSYVPGDLDSLASAVFGALSMKQLPPDASPFDPTTYFSWLFDGSDSGA